MTNQEIIEQGYLEAYLTDDLSEEQRREVEASFGEKEIQTAFLDIQKKLEFLAFEGALSASDQVKLNVLGQIMSVKKKRPSFLVAASVTVAIGSMLVAYVFYSQYKEVHNQLAGLLNQNEELADNVQQVNQKMDRMKNDLTVLINPAFSRVIMNSTQDGIVQQAVIYFNPSERQVYLNTSTLPELSEDQQYQLWALIDGQPVDAGTFDVLKDQFQQMKQFERVDAFAVTIEPKGGSEGPTLEKMQVYGEV